MSNEVRKKIESFTYSIVNIGGVLSLINILIGGSLLVKGLRADNIKYIYWLGVIQLIGATVGIFSTFLCFSMGFKMSYEAYSRDEKIKELLKTIKKQDIKEEDIED